MKPFLQFICEKMCGESKTKEPVKIYFPDVASDTLKVHDFCQDYFSNDFDPLGD